MALDFFLRETIYQHREDDILYAGAITLTNVSRQPLEAGLVEISTNAPVGGTVTIGGSLASVGQTENLALAAGGQKLTDNTFDQIDSVAIAGLTGADVLYIRAKTESLQPMTQRRLLGSFKGQISFFKSDLRIMTPGAEDTGKLVAYHKIVGICSGDFLLRQGEWFRVMGAPTPIINFDSSIFYYKTFLERE
jgi:hypothetical protein